MAQTVSSVRPTLSFTEALRGYVSAFKTWRLKRAQYLETTRELNSLDDRELSDLGIARSNIASIAHEHVYGG